jgi:two-component system LytT family response regulator
MTLRVLVVDDEPLVRERIGALVSETEGLQLVGVAANGIEALNLIDAHQPDLVFIDVEMPELSGFGVIAALDGDDKVPGVVFITAFERYAVKAFDVGAIDYLHKPITRQRFAAAVERAKDRLMSSPDSARRTLVAGAAQADRERGYRTRYVVRFRNAHHIIRVDQIEWIDAADNYLQLHAGGKTHLARGTMKNAEAELDPERFVRIHRSAIVAVDRIASVSVEQRRHIIRLTSGATLRASRQFATRVRALLDRRS